MNTLIKPPCCNGTTNTPLNTTISNRVATASLSDNLLVEQTLHLDENAITQFITEKYSTRKIRFNGPATSRLNGAEYGWSKNYWDSSAPILAKLVPVCECVISSKEKGNSATKEMCIFVDRNELLTNNVTLMYLHCVETDRYGDWLSPSSYDSPKDLIKMEVVQTTSKDDAYMKTVKALFLKPAPRD